MNLDHEARTKARLEIQHALEQFRRSDTAGRAQRKASIQAALEQVRRATPPTEQRWSVKEYAALAVRSGLDDDAGKTAVRMLTTARVGQAIEVDGVTFTRQANGVAVRRSGKRSPLRSLDCAASFARSGMDGPGRSAPSVSEPGDGRTLEGHAAVFNVATSIRDHVGVYQERVAAGTFRRSLAEKTPIIQYDHGTHPTIGSIPIGKITEIREDNKGLFVRARLSDSWMIEPVRIGIRDNAITGMSFKFRVIADLWSKDANGKDLRTLTEVDLLECGPVCWPAYSSTSVKVRNDNAAGIAEAVKRFRAGV